MYTEEEMAELRSRELHEKKAFVEELGKALSHHRTSIEKLDYDVYATETGFIYEYLVITYRGGAIAARNCRGNSLSAIFDEVAKMFNGGYYDEVENYRTTKAHSLPIGDLTCETPTE